MLRYSANHLIKKIDFILEVEFNRFVALFMAGMDNTAMKRKILVLDDDDGILEVISYVLNDSGFVVKTLSTGKCIFEEIKRFHPDLVLMDIMLAEMDGRVICQELKSKAETEALPVILISASHNVYGNPNHKGAPNDFIAKPFDIDHLVRIVKNQFNE